MVSRSGRLPYEYGRRYSLVSYENTRSENSTWVATKKIHFEYKKSINREIKKKGGV